MKKSFVFISITALVSATACTVNPDGTDTTTTTTTSHTTSSSSGGSGGSGGAGGDGGQGGSGGEVSWEFACANQPMSHLVVMVDVANESVDGYIAADGWADYPISSPLPNVPWSVMHIDQVEGRPRTRFDFGAVPSGTLLETNWGLSLDPSMSQPVPAVDNDTWFCAAQACPGVVILGCYGTEEIGRVDSNLVTGTVGWGGLNGSNSNVRFVAP